MTVSQWLHYYQLQYTVILPMQLYYILLIGETLLANRCSLVVDGSIVNEAVEGFIEGLMLMFASYYIFNIAYPEGLAATLEFIQR